MDFMKMMKAAKDMQSNMAALKDQIATIEAAGTAGAGLVTVTVSGKGELKSIAIDPSLLKAEEKEILEDLIVAAHRDAHAKAEAMMQAKVAETTSGMGLPAGLKLPF
jgi:hypothetical protein